MTREPLLISKHYLESRLVVIYGGIYFFTLIVATVMFVMMMSSKFYHPLFWTWMVWSFITTYFFFLFMRSVLSPAVQIYPEMIVLSYPKSRTIRKESLKAIQVYDSHVELAFIEDNKEQNLKIKIRAANPPE